MGRRLPRSFFWIDQSVIRSGAWVKLSPEARLCYVALAASCDREGISIWSAPKLMELAACREREAWQVGVAELESGALIERLPEHSPPAIRLRELEASTPGAGPALPGPSRPDPLASAPAAASPIVVHTHTTIQLGGRPSHVESGNPD